MKRKTIIICLIVFIIAVLWISGVIPMFILKTIGARNMQKEYPEWKLKFVSAEYDEAFGDYLIKIITATLTNCHRILRLEGRTLKELKKAYL